MNTSRIVVRMELRLMKRKEKLFIMFEEEEEREEERAEEERAEEEIEEEERAEEERAADLGDEHRKSQ
ncbi:hypothetical protein KUDE01_002557 [Dissostichus eleginoides]|uniref:Uncharacterized protein n=1 Tax=Dissostichus eleginoides TaxID=100907 RepID=A0AAD9B4L4_DISEL|nr:hypothetical protein KUDE01_002557 [Dissostichus eleginoides]